MLPSAYKSKGTNKDDNREHWLATNLTNINVAIGDLISVPVFTPGSTLDLLRYQTKDQVSNSKILDYLIQINWISVVIKFDGYIKDVEIING